MISVFNEHQSKTLAFLESSKAEKANSDTLVKSITQNLRLDEQAVEWQKLPAEKADALRYAQAIKAAYATRAEHLHKQPISKEQADNIEAAMFSMIDALAAAAQMEFEAGLAEDYADKKLKPTHVP